MDKFDNNITVKSILTPYFELSMVQDNNGRYCVIYTINQKSVQSEWITDYNTASYIFDIKMQELEGH